MVHGRSFLLHVAAGAVLVTGCAASDPAGGKGGTVAYRPGVRINWTARQVELDAEVVLREGALELLACRTGSKEHESILRVKALPSHVYEALGLIGLTPGTPVGWDEKSERIIPATGDRIEINIQYRHDGKNKTVAAHEWLWNADKQRAMPPMTWVFAGSQRLEDGTFYADLDGTLITVVDFSSALISQPSSYSADNAELWLEPYTQRVPKEGTSCQLILRPAKPNELPIDVNRQGQVSVEGKVVGIDALVRRVREGAFARVQLTVAREVRMEIVARLKAALTKAGVTSIVIRSKSVGRESQRATTTPDQPQP